MNKNKEIVSELLMGATTIITVITAIFYINGSALHTGYLASFGIDEGLFPISFEQTLVKGFQANGSIGLKLIVPFMTIVLTIFALCFFFKLLEKVKRIKDFMDKYFYINKPEKSVVSPGDAAVNNVFKLVISSVVLVSVFLSILALYSMAYRYGNKQGNDTKAKIEDGLRGRGHSSHERVTLRKKDKKEIKGTFVISSNERIALITLEGVVVTPKEEIESIQIK